MRPLPSSFLPRTVSTVRLWLLITAGYSLTSELLFALHTALPARLSPG